MGNLTVTLVRAKNLIAADRGGASDPYVVFKLNGKEVHKSEVVKKTVNPEYNETFVQPIVRICLLARTAASSSCLGINTRPFLLIVVFSCRGSIHI